MFAVVLSNRLLSLNLDWSTELLDVAREGLCKHLRVEPRELAEDVLEHKVLGDGI